MEKNRERQSYIYKYIILLFNISLVFSTNIRVKDGVAKKVLKCFLKALNIITALLFVSLFEGFFTTPIKVFVNIMIVIVSIGCRYVLCKRIDTFKRIIRQLSTNGLQDRNEELLMQRFISIILFSEILRIILHTLYLSVKGMNGITIWCRNVPAVNLMYFIVLFEVCSLPITAFALLYIAFCIKIRSKILNLLNGLFSMNINVNKEVLQSYSTVKAKVESFDNKVGFLMFLMTLHNSINMYLFMLFFLNPNYHLGDKIHHFLVFLCNFVPFITATGSAVSVTESAQRFVSKAKTLHSTAVTEFFQPFHCSADHDISLTLWKIHPIRRNFIVGALGTVFTYTALFYSFEDNPLI